MSPAETDRFHLDLLRAYLDSTDDGIFVVCDELKFLLANRVMEEWLGEPENSLTRHGRRVSVTSFFPDPATRDRLLRALGEALTGRTRRLECRLEPPRAIPRWVEVGLRRVDLDAGIMVIGVARDVTANHQDRVFLKQLSGVVEQTADSVVITNLAGVIEYVNPAFEKNTGFGRDEAVGQTPRLVKSGHHDAGFYARLWSTIKRGEVFRGVLVNRRKDGSLYHEEKTITPLRDEGGAISHFVSTGKDVTERMEAQAHLDRLAYQDPLTGLPNRNRFRERLVRTLEENSRNALKTALLLLNLDNFKAVNESLGREAGDVLLRVVAERLRAALPADGFLAYLGNDEFAVIASVENGKEPASRAAADLLNSLAAPFSLQGQEVFASTCLGIALAPEDGSDGDALWNHADTAMHRAKESGRNHYRFYAPDMTERALAHLTLRTELAQALERNEFRLHYQPMIDVLTGRITGVEALMRWQHPREGLIGPDRFIPALEESGLIVPAGDWLFRTACQQTQRWHDLFPQPVRVAVNVSARQFAASDFLESIGCLRCFLGRQGLCAGITDFEITESVFLDGNPVVLDHLRVLRESGIHLSIDDFGTGFSSLAYLTRFPVDRLKIDRAFVRDMLEKPETAALVRAIVAMARALNLTVVGEGVETHEQFAFLKGLGCDQFQGYLFSPPVPAEAMTELLRRQDEQSS